jgi:hypothetical protein
VFPLKGSSFGGDRQFGWRALLVQRNVGKPVLKKAGGGRYRLSLRRAG